MLPALAWIDGDQHELYAMSRGLAEEDSTKVGAPIIVGSMSPVIVEVDEWLGKMTATAGDELVLDEDEEVDGGSHGGSGVAAAAT